MPVNPSKESCCGCTACASICNKRAIQMLPDSLGFLYPHVDVSICNNCGRCEKVCAFNDNYDKSHLLQEPTAYGARHKNIEELQYSRSGAVFIALSDYVLGQGGIVYGVGYTDHFRVVHKRATTAEERNEFKGSKYVQSDMRGILPQIKQDLCEGYLVLFSGTPCQTAAVNSYISKKLRDKLVLVDIICHAAPSPYIWRDYLTAVEKKAGSCAVQVYFRDKTYGWAASHNERFVFENGRQIVDHIHRDLFYKNLSTRLSCHNCQYCNLNRPSDITIADFWGYEKTDARELNKDGQGISLVLVNSAKGQTLYNLIKSDLIAVETYIENSLQPNLIKPTKESNLRFAFEKDYSENGFNYVACKYSDWSVLKRINNKANWIIKKIKRILCILVY